MHDLRGKSWFLIVLLVLGTLAPFAQAHGAACACLAPAPTETRMQPISEAATCCCVAEQPELSAPQSERPQEQSPCQKDDCGCPKACCAAPHAMSALLPNSTIAIFGAIYSAAPSERVLVTAGDHSDDVAHPPKS